MKSLKDLVSTNSTATFVYFKHNLLWYRLDDGFEFPVPPSDITGESEVNSSERPMAMMKWIRKHLEYINSAKEQEDETVRSA